MKKLCAVAAVLAATGASAADLNSGVLAPPEGNRWEGAYAGGNIGGAWTNGKAFGETELSAAYGYVATATLNSSVTGGLQAGYNYQIGKIVLGFEGDIALGGASTKTSVTSTAYISPWSSNSATANVSIDWYGSLRVRLGLSPSKNFLVYATGGIAFGQISTSYSSIIYNYMPNTAFTNGVPEKSNIQVGWIAGAGAEYALSRSWSLRAEALYMSLGSVEAKPAYGTAVSGDIEMGVARAGVNYQF